MTVDIEKLDAMAKAATQGVWLYDGSTLNDWDSGSYSMEWMPNGEDCEDGANANFKADGAFMAAANPATVLELTQTIRDLQSSVQGLKTGYEAYERVNAELRAECEKLRANASLQKLLPEVSDALEELEMHGQHSDQGYRKLKDWYRKVLLACRVIQSPMFGAEHGDLVSQNTWLRKMVEHYAQQHAPLEQIPDSDGWSTRLPGYDLPALLRDASRYRWLRNSAGSADWEFLGYQGKETTDQNIDAALSKEQSHD